MKRASWTIVLGLLVLMAVAVGQTTKPGWKSTVTTENGIKIVKNPAEPLFGTFAFDLQDDLILGGDPEKADSYFPRGAQVNVDRDGNLYVSDMGNRRIQIFDKTGRFLRQLGRQGQGPGEYMFPGLAQVDSEGNIYVSSGRDVNIYGKDGVFRKKILLGTFLGRSILGPNANFMGTPQPLSGSPKESLILFDPQSQVSKTICETIGEFDPDQKVIVRHLYSSSYAFSMLTEETFAYGFSSDYKIKMADGQGRTSLIFTMDEKPESITAKEKSFNAEKGPKIWYGTSGKPEARDFRYPAHRPYFSGFINDDCGRLYVKRLTSILEKDAPTPVDVFSKDGIYLYRMIWKTVPVAIKAGFFYEVRQDEETGETKIVRSRIRNWDKMKNS